MDNSEFETRAFANPDDCDQDFQDAAAGNPERQMLVENIRAFNARLDKIANTVAAPAGLADRLLSAVSTQDDDPLQDDAAEQRDRDSAGDSSADKSPRGQVIRFPGNWQPARLVGMAAALVLAVGVAYSSLFGNQPSAAEIEFGQQVVSHVHMEQDEINSSAAADLQLVYQLFSSVGGAIPDQQAIDNLQISFARPCVIIPQNRSAHLVMEGSQGPVNIIIVNNTPVQQEFRLGDERFEAIVVPLATGNLILVGEKNEQLRDYQQVLDDNVSWTI